RSQKQATWKRTSRRGETLTADNALSADTFGLMTGTPAIRGFLVRLDELIEAKRWSALGAGEITIGHGDRAALVRLPHTSDADRDIELEIDDRQVVVIYWDEHVPFTSRDEALRFIEMLGDGRVEVRVQRTLAFAKIESYRDDLP